jgi:hypothetical protein
VRRLYVADSLPVRRKETPHIRAVVDGLCVKYPALWDNGTWGIRNIRGKEQLSNHARGIAGDVSWRFMPGHKGVRFGGRKQAVEAMDFLVANAEALGIQMIIDYGFGKHGRAWRCDRWDWKVYDKPTVTFGGVGDWFHVEVDGKVKPIQVSAVFAVGA